MDWDKWHALLVIRNFLKNLMALIYTALTYYSFSITIILLFFFSFTKWSKVNLSFRQIHFSSYLKGWLFQTLGCLNTGTSPCHTHTSIPCWSYLCWLLSFIMWFQTVCFYFYVFLKNWITVKLTSVTDVSSIRKWIGCGSICKLPIEKPTTLNETLSIRFLYIHTRVCIWFCVSMCKAKKHWLVSIMNMLFSWYYQTLCKMRPWLS